MEAEVRQSVAGAAVEEQEVALVVDQLIVAPLPPQDSNISWQVLAVQLVKLARSPDSPKLQDPEQEVSSLTKDKRVMYCPSRRIALPLNLVTDIICLFLLLLLLLLSLDLTGCLCWWRLVRSVTSSISHLFFFHHVRNLCCLAKKIKVSS
jgi:hypothetical protein